MTGAPLARLRWLLVRAAAGALYVFNAIGWFRGGETRWTVWIWLASILLFLISFLPSARLRRSVPDGPDDVSPFRARVILGAIASVAFLLRVVNLARIPLDVHGDFTSMGLGARDLLEGRVAGFFSSGWADLPWMAYIQPAITMRLFGDSLFGMSMEAVIAGTVTVLGVYVLSRTLFDRRTLALIAAATAAIGYTDIHFSRVSAYMDPVPWLLFGLVFLVEGLRSNRTAMFALSGVSVAVGFEMYYSGRLIGVVIFLFTVYLALFHRPLLVRRWKGFLAFAAGGVLGIGPYLFFHLQNFHSFMDRTRQVYVMTPENVTHLLGKYQATSRAQMLAEQAWRSLLTFDYTADSSTQFGFSHPMINPILGPLLVLGVALGVRRFRDPGQALLLIWLGTGIVLGSILTIDAPFWPRLVVLLPAVAILVAAALDRILRAVAGRKWGPAAVLAPAGLLLVAVGYQNARLYFGGTIPTYASPPAWVGRLIAKSPPGTGFCMVRGPLDFDDRVPQFLGKGRDMRTIAREEVEKSEERCVAEGRVWVIIRPDHDAVLASLNQKWPGGRVETHDYPQGDPGPIFWYPPKTGAETGPAPP